MCAMKKEVDFGLDGFQKPKLLNSGESLAQTVLNLLLMKPGQSPGQPHLGVNIREYLYKYVDEIDVNGLKSKIYSQVSDLLPYLITGEIAIGFKSIKGQAVMVIGIPITYEDNTQTILFGFNKNSTNGELYTRYQIEDIQY